MIYCSLILFPCKNHIPLIGKYSGIDLKFFLWPITSLTISPPPFSPPFLPCILSFANWTCLGLLGRLNAYIYTHTHIYIYTYVHIYVCVYTHLYIYVYIYKCLEVRAQRILAIVIMTFIIGFAVCSLRTFCLLANTVTYSWNVFSPLSAHLMPTFSAVSAQALFLWEGSSESPTTPLCLDYVPAASPSVLSLAV